MHDSESAIKRLSNQISKGWSNGLLDVLQSKPSSSWLTHILTDGSGAKWNINNSFLIYALSSLLYIANQINTLYVDTHICDKSPHISISHS